MRTSRLHIIAVVAVVLAGISAALWAQDRQAAPDHAERAKAVQIVRLINTEEVEYNAGFPKIAIESHGRFATWDELYQSGVVKANQEKWA